MSIIRAVLRIRVQYDLYAYSFIHISSFYHDKPRIYCLMIRPHRDCMASNSLKSSH